MKKKINKFGLVEGFGRRLLILTLVLVVWIVSLWTFLQSFLTGDARFQWVFWLVLGASLIAWIILVIWVERSQRRYHD